MNTDKASASICVHRCMRWFGDQSVDHSKFSSQLFYDLTVAAGPATAKTIKPRMPRIKKHPRHPWNPRSKGFPPLSWCAPCSRFRIGDPAPV